MILCKDNITKVKAFQDPDYIINWRLNWYVWYTEDERQDYNELDDIPGTPPESKNDSENKSIFTLSQTFSARSSF